MSGRRLLHNIVQAPHHGSLRGSRPPPDEGDGCGALFTFGSKALNDFRKVGHAHEKHQRAVYGRQAPPFDPTSIFRGVFVSGDEGHGRRHRAMGHRNTRVRRRRDGGRHTRNDFKFQPGSGNGFRLFPAPTKDERIATFQADHPLPRLSVIDQQPIDLRLIAILAAPAPADVQTFSRWRHMLQERFIREIVVQHHIGLLQTFLAAYREQLRISGTGPDQIYCSCSRRHTTQACP